MCRLWLEPWQRFYMRALPDFRPQQWQRKPVYLVKRVGSKGRGRQSSVRMQIERRVGWSSPVNVWSRHKWDKVNSAESVFLKVSRERIVLYVTQRSNNSVYNFALRGTLLPVVLWLCVKNLVLQANIIIDNIFSEMQYQLPECHVELCDTTAKECGKCYLLVK